MIDVNGIPVIAAHVTLPSSGAWSAIVETAAEIPTGTAVLTDSETGPWLGSVTSSGGVSGVFAALMVGGAGGGAEIDAQHFRNLPVSGVLAALALSAGEIVSPLSDPGILAQTLAFFSAPTGPVSHSLESLAELLGVSWRIGQDGGIWLGTGRQAAPVYPSPQLTGAVVAVKRIGTLCDGLTIRPGDSVAGFTVSSVEYYIERAYARAAVTVE